MSRPRKKQTGVYEKNPGSNVWYVMYRLEAEATGVGGERVPGKLVRKRIGSQQEAIDYATKIRHIRAFGDGTLPDTAKVPARTTVEEAEVARAAEEAKTSITVGELCDQYLLYIQAADNPNRPRDQVNPPQRIRAIKEEFGHRAAATLIPHQITDWLTRLKKDKATATLNRYKSTFSSVYRHAKERGVVVVNPVRDVPQFKVKLPDPRWLRDGEEKVLRGVLNRWIEECPDHHKLTKLFLRCHPIELTVALGTGMRRGNQYALRWEEHVDFDGRVFHLPPAMMKSGKAQNIPMIDDVYDALMELRTIQAEIEELQAESRVDGTTGQRMVSNGRVFNIAENREWWYAALREAKIKNFRWHDLRHTFATRLVAGNVNLRMVQEACGHGSMNTTTRYAHVDDKDMHSALSVLNHRR